MIWKLLCDYVTSCKKANQKEKDFENKIDLFFQAYLGWKELNGDIHRQVKIEFAHTKGYADIILFAEGKEEIIVELKKPNNIQVNSNVRQLTDYMKQKRCNFGLYIGEKFELYYDEDDKSKKRAEPTLVTSIDFIEGCKEGQKLMTLLSRSSYSSERLEEYCKQKIELLKIAKYWSSKSGVDCIYRYILNQSQLSGDLVAELADLLKIDIVFSNSNVNQIVKNEVATPSKKITHNPSKEYKIGDKTQYSLDGNYYVPKSRFVLEVAKAIIKNSPMISYFELKNILPLRAHSNPTLLTKKEWMSKTYDAQKRYCRREGDLLCDVNGVEFYVSTQWTKQSIDEEILPITQRYNLRVYEK